MNLVIAHALSDAVMLLWFQLNPSVSSFQRRFVSEIKRCEEMERILGRRAPGMVYLCVTWTIYIVRVVNTSRLIAFC